jgi:outer membrane biosynthesis protein TonB
MCDRSIDRSIDASLHPPRVPSPQRTGFGGRGKRSAQVRQAKAPVTGALEPDIIRRIVRAHINEVRHCYNQGLDRDPDLAGVVEIAFTIGVRGNINAADVASSTLADAAVAPCIAKAVRTWKFPKPADGKPVEVRYPFRFSAE